MTSADHIIRFRELIGDRAVAMLTTAAPSGEFHSRPLTLAEIDDDGALWFFVDSTAQWTVGIRGGEGANLSFADGDRHTWVSVAGTATVVDDRARIDRLWTAAAQPLFPDGPESPSLRMLRMQPTTVEYWDAPASAVVRLVLMAKAALGGTPGATGESGTIDLA